MHLKICLKEIIMETPSELNCINIESILASNKNYLIYLSLRKKYYVWRQDVTLHPDTHKKKTFLYLVYLVYLLDRSTQGTKCLFCGRMNVELHPDAARNIL